MKVLLLLLAVGIAEYSLAQPPLPTIPNGPQPATTPPMAMPPPQTQPPSPAPRPSAQPPRGPSPGPTPVLPPPPPGTPTSPPPPGGSSSSTSGGSGGGGGGGSGTFSDADILTFAYNLECLEGQFYSCAAFGTALPTNITGNGPAPTSCKKATLNSTVGTYAAELANEETAHVQYLYQALTNAGLKPVCPLVNIDTAFEAAAEAAFGQSGTALNPTFDPTANDVFFLHGSFIFEDLGASAYIGAVTLLQNSDYRLAALEVGNAESYHASLGRLLLYQILNTTPAYGKTVGQITSAIVAAINKLAGSPQVKYELTNNKGSSISNVDSKAFVPLATPAQVLKVVTLGAANGNGGGFFPNNLNGNIKN